MSRFGDGSLTSGQLKRLEAYNRAKEAADSYYWTGSARGEPSDKVINEEKWASLQNSADLAFGKFWNAVNEV